MTLATALAESGGNPDQYADLVGQFLELLNRPKWQSRARCRGFGTDAFFPGRGEVSMVALTVCAQCPVREECRSAGKGEAGIWGGLSERGRRIARRGSAA